MANSFFQWLRDGAGGNVGLQGVWLVRASVTNQPRRRARFLLPGLVGVTLGIAALSILQPNILKLVIAGLLILYGGFFTLRSSLPKLERPTPAIDASVGFVGGVIRLIKNGHFLDKASEIVGENFFVNWLIMMAG